MPDKQNGISSPTKAQLADYIRSVNKTAVGLSDDEILDKLVSVQPKIGSLVSDYSNPLLQGPVPIKSKLPLFQDVEKSVIKAGQAKSEKSVQEDFNDVETLRIKARTAAYDLDAQMQPGQLPVISKTRKDVASISKQGDEAFEKFKVKYNQDPEIQRLKSSVISNMTQFTDKDNLGSTYVDNAKLRKYIRTKMPQAANTQFEDYMVNNFGSDILFEAKKPELQKVVLKKAKEKNIQVPENFLELNKEVAKNAQAISDNVTKQIQSANQDATSQIEEINNGYKSQIEQIKQKYTNKEFVQQNFNTDDEFRAAYEKEVGEAFDNYSRNYSNISSKYIAVANKLKGDYERSMKDLQLTSEQQRADISKLMQESLIDMNESENAKRLAISKVQDNINPFVQGGTSVKGLASGLVNWVNGIATNLSIGNNSQWASDFKDFSSNLSKKLSRPSNEIKSIKDLLDPDKFATSAGVMIGQMLPAIGVSVATRGILGGGIGSTLAAGTIQWFDEASQARASNYNSMIGQGLDPEEARIRSNKTYSGYLATLPLSMIESAAMFGKFGKGSLLRRYISNVGAEIPSETLQEVIQNEADEAIVDNRKFDFGKAFNISNAYKTGLNVAPASIVMPLPGSAMESARENEAISQTANWALRVTTAPIQSMANNIIKNGLLANISSLESMRHNGLISEDGMNGMKSMLAEVHSDMETAKASGLNNKQQSVYAGLMGNVRNLQDAVNQIESQEMTDEAKKEATETAKRRLNNAREVASDYLNTKNGNYAEILDKDGDKYIVSHDDLSEMLADESFKNDIKEGNVRVQLNYNKKAGEKLGELSKTLLSLNKNFNEGLRQYNESERQLNALRKKLNIPEQPTSSTTLEGLIGQRVTYRVRKFPVSINMTGILGVQNNKLILTTDDGGVVNLGKASGINGMMPSDMNIEFEPQRYQGEKMTKEEAKLPSLLAMFAGKIEPKTLTEILSDVISDVKKSDISKMVKAFDAAYQRKMQQKSINESLPKPAKQIDVVEPEVGKEYDGNEVTEMIAQVGDKSAKSFFEKVMSFSLRDFVASTIDLDDLYENNEEFRNRVEQEKGEKKDRYVSDYSNTEKVPAVIVDGKIQDGMSRLARLYVNGDKIATVFENIKTKKDATTASQREIKEGVTTGDIGKRKGVEEEQEQATTKTDTSNRNIIGKKTKVKPAIARINSSNINDIVTIDGNTLQKKILNDVKKVVIAIKELVKESTGFDIEVNIHNQDTFTKAVLEIGGTKEQSLSRGFYMSSDGSIHINLDTATSDTMLHEGFHPILDYLAANDPSIINKMYGQLTNISEASPIINRAIQSYEGDTTQKKEAITDFVAGVADGRIVLNPSNFQKIKSYVLYILNKIGIGEGGSMLMNVRNESDLINLANFVTEKFRGGETITLEGLESISGFMAQPSGYQDSSGNDITNNKIQFSVNNDFSDVKTKTTFSYIKNNEQFEQLKKDGFITEGKTLDDFVGKKMMLHSPDNAFTGQILKNGEILIEGKGGVFYPIRFHKDGYFWASTSTAAKSMANRLNQMLKDNGGKIYMALVSSPSDKLLSSTTAANGVVELFSSSAMDKAIGVSPSSVIDALSKAASTTFEKRVKKKDKNGNDILDKNGNPVYVVKKTGLNIKVAKSKVVDGVRRNTTIDEVRASISDKLSADKSTFEDRKVFTTAFISNIVDLIKGTKAEQILGRFFDKGILNTAFQQQGKIEKRYNLSKANVIQSVSEMLSEPMLKNSKSGQVYAVLEVSGELEPTESNKHESYPMAIRSKDGKGTTVHILSEREDWNNRFADPETGNKVEKDRMLNVFPTSGVSNEPLTLIPKTDKNVPVGSPQYQMAAQIGVEKQSGTTQVATTTGSYVKAAKIAEKLGAKSILDYGAGLGLGSDAIKSVIGNVESFEPNAERWQGKSPVTYTNTSDINKKYDAVINLNVLNVVPRDIRDAIVIDIFDKLNIGGSAIISTRKWSGDVNAAKNFVKGPEEKSIIIKRKSGGQEVDVYQKGFDGNELVDYVKSILGESANVIKDNSFGASGVIVTKNNNNAVAQFQMEAPTKSKAQVIKENLPLASNLSNLQIERLAKGVTLWEQWATSYGLLGKEIKIAEEYKAGYVSQELYKADKAVKNVIKELKSSKKSGYNIKDEEITRYLTGQKTTGSKMPLSLKRALNVMRIHIDSLTEEMILNGVINDPVEIEEFRNNKGKYLGRFYDMFINGKGLTLNNIVEKLKDVDEAVMEKARNLIRVEVRKNVTRANPNLSKEELNKVIENEIDDILNNIIEDTSNPYVKKPMKGSVNMKQLMARQDIVEPIRALMGEITNPLSRYYATIGKMSSIVAGMRYLNEVRKIGMGKFLFEQNDPERPKGTVRITSETNKNLLPLAGLYTFPEVRDEFSNYMVYQNAGPSILSKAMGAAKYMNTVGNIPTHIKNFASNIGILVNNGYIFDATNAIQFIINEPRAFEKAYEELRKSGALNNNINATELRSYFQDNNDIDKVLSNKFKNKNVIKSASKTLTDIYNLEDDVFKVIAYIVESQRYAKALYKVEFSQLSNTDKDAVTKRSIEIVKSILPLYSRVPPFVKGMNKVAYLGSFMSFTAESIRISKNTVVLALKELGDPNTRFIGAKRLAGVITWNTAYGWATTTSAAAVGSMASGAFTYWVNAAQQLLTDDDDEYKKRIQKEKSIRRVAREFNLSSDIFPVQASEGKLIYYDIGSINPYSFIANFLNRLDQLVRDDGEGIAMDILRSLGYSLYPFIKQDFVFDKLITAYQALTTDKIPTDSYGKDIYKKGDSAVKKAQALAVHVGGLFTPGMLKNIYKSMEYAKEGNVENSKAEVVSSLSIRKYAIDGNIWFYNRVRDVSSTHYQKDIKAYSSEYSSISYKSVPDSEKEESYLKNVGNIRRIVNEISADYKAAIDIGVNEGSLIESLSKSGYSDQIIAAVIETTLGADRVDNELYLRRKH